MDGFTILEVLIVLIVLGIVAALGLPVLASSLDHARLNAAASEIMTAFYPGPLTLFAKQVVRCDACVPRGADRPFPFR